MAWNIVTVVFAAWGLLCFLWVSMGWLFGEIRAIHLYFCPPGEHPDGCIRKFGWLRSLGLVSGPLLILDSKTCESEQAVIQSIHPYVEFCRLEELPSRLELERKNLG